MMKFIFLAAVVHLAKGIINGQDAPDLEHPWFVQVIMQDSNDIVCGGAILSKQWVITAAHCLDEMKSVVLRFGTSISDKHAVTMTSKNIFIHPSYNNTTSENDIALIKLPNPLFLITNRIHPIKLVSNSDRRESFEDSVSYAYGHGTVNDEYPSNISRHLKYGVFIGISNIQCYEVFAEGFFFGVTSSTLCVEGACGNNASTCNVDSGGPLIQNDTLIGIASFSTADCVGPSAFSRLTYYMDWINDTMGISGNKTIYSSANLSIYFWMIMIFVIIVLGIVIINIILIIYKKYFKKTQYNLQGTVQESTPLQRREGYY